MPTVLPTAEFLQASGLMLDVRSPAEYEQGHIPGAISFPLFTNAERAQVGTCYKQKGREVAIEQGLMLVGPKLADFVREAKCLTRDRQLRIHCWRGGMRSGSMAWLMETAGFQVSLLDLGYKGFRHWVRTTLAMPKSVLILGGMTGTGKTAFLSALASQGEQTLDLEALANHRGSSYGNLGLPAQPSTEHFENLIAMQWAELEPNRPIWIEAESRMVGTCRIPDELFNQMLTAPVLEIQRLRSERVAILLEMYGAADPKALVEATARLQKRLGGQDAKQAIADIQAGRLANAIARVLNYYDKTYQYDLQRRGVAVYPVNVSGQPIAVSASQLISMARSISIGSIQQSPIQNQLQQVACHEPTPSPSRPTMLPSDS